MIRTKLAATLTSLVLAAGTLAGCATSAAQTTAQTTGQAGVTAVSVLAANEAIHVAEGDASYTESEVTEITLTGATATSSGDGVTIEGSTVTITAAGTYRLSGSLSDGQIVVNAPDATVQLILNGVDISSSTTSAIAAVEAEKVIVLLPEGSENTLTDTTTYAEDAEANAALYSAGNMTITGEGALTVSGRGNDAIASQDGLVIESGTITVDAVDDGIRGKDYLVITGGVVRVTAGGDGLKSDNAEDVGAGYVALSGGTVTIDAEVDGVDAARDVAVSDGALTVASGDDAVHAEETLVIDGGTVKITASTEGLEASDIVVNGGAVSVVAGDDGVNAAGGTSEDTGTDAAPGGAGGGGEAAGDYSVTVTGGALTIDAEGDGLDSNGSALITGGTVVVHGPDGNGNGALDVNGTFEVSGGTLTASGSAGMVVSPSSESAQGWISATLSTAIATGTTFEILDADGAVVATVTATKTLQNVVYSAGAITDGQQYRIQVDTETVATVTAGEAAAGGVGRGPGSR